MSMVMWVALLIGAAIIAGLGFYAGTLLFRLKEQNQRQQHARQQRIDTITESIQLIAKAIEQQQCNLSEGAIRLINLMESLPVKDVPDCQQDFPALYELYEQVRHLPTHAARDALDKKTRREQDKVREEHEARLESRILKEIAPLKEYRAPAI